MSLTHFRNMSAVEPRSKMRDSVFSWANPSTPTTIGRQILIVYHINRAFLIKLNTGGVSAGRSRIAATGGDLARSQSTYGDCQC